MCRPHVVGFRYQKGQSLYKLTLTLQLIIVCSLFIGLAIWQLQRADYKKSIVSSYSAAEEKKATEKLAKYDKVNISGTIDQKRYFLLDNKTWQGNVGYELIAIFNEAESQQNYLLSLGWIAGGNDRQKLPDVTLPQMILEVMVRTDFPQQLISLGPDDWDSGWPKRIQQVDIEKTEQLFNTSFQPWLLRVDKPLLENVIPIWRPVVMSSTKHYGYALQWFLLAVAWFVCSCWVFRRLDTV